MIHRYYFVLLSIVAASSKHRAPIFDFQASSGERYFGTIRENEVDVQLTPEIRVVDGTGPICEYVLENLSANDTSSDLGGQQRRKGDNYSNNNLASSLFDYRILNAADGRVELRLKPGTFVDCSQGSLNFYLRAKRCSDDSLSDRALVEIRIEDTNNHEPEFERVWYMVEVNDEPKANYSIVQLRASDKDCGHPYGEICRYEITNSGQKWFHVTDSGVLRNTVPLDQDSYLITVMAHDCGMRRSSAPAVVTVKVKRPSDKAAARKQQEPIVSPMGLFPGQLQQDDDEDKECSKSGLTKIADRLEYFAGRGALPLFSGAELNICPSFAKTTGCPVSSKDAAASLETKITLSADFERNFDAKTCDRESLSLNLQKDMCGADQSTVELLPSSKKVHLENDIADDKTVVAAVARKAVEKREEEVYVFDGRQNAVLVPDPVFGANLSESFTLHFWMKREKPAAGWTSKKSSDDHHQHHKKENILCLSDDHRMNRHHFAVYTKNCKLEVLFRRERSTGNVQKQKNPAGGVKESGDGLFEPAEWRWHLDQTCDNNWHHYTLNIKFPEIELLVDGVATSDVYEAPEILDDWPMHHVKNLKNRMVIGACWQGASGRMSQHFKGYLSAVTLLPHKIEKPSVVQCLLECKERLEFFGLDKLKAGEEAVFNRDMTELSLKAKNARDFSYMLHKVSYVNSRRNPTIGDRFVRIVVTWRCPEGSTYLPTLLPVVETRISVENGPRSTRLLLKGSMLILNYLKDQVSQNGVSLFPDLKVYALGDNDSELLDQTLDYCKIETEPLLDKSREFFSSPSALLAASSDASTLDFEQTLHGLLIKGRASTKTYEKLLKTIHYFNSRPDEFPRRTFAVFCSMYDGRLSSERFMITMNIEEPKRNVTVVGQSESVVAAAVPAMPPHKIVAKKEPPLAHHYDHNRAFAKMEKRLELMAPEPKIFSLDTNKASGGAIAVVSVVCIGFLLLLAVVAMLKIRSSFNKRRRRGSDGGEQAGGKSTSRRRAARRPSTNGGTKVAVSDTDGTGAPLKNTDLTWDDAGMTITINPIEVATPVSSAMESDARDQGDYSDLSSDDDSYRDDDCYSDDDDDADANGRQVLPHLENNANCDDINGHSPAGCGSNRRRSSSPAVAALEWEDDAYRV